VYLKLGDVSTQRIEGELGISTKLNIGVFSIKKKGNILNMNTEITYNLPPKRTSKLLNRGKCDMAN
jgi:hypothetical protein